MCSWRSNESTNIILWLPLLFHSLGSLTLLTTITNRPTLDHLPQLLIQRYNMQLDRSPRPSKHDGPLRTPRHKILLSPLQYLFSNQLHKRMGLVPMCLEFHCYRLFPRKLGSYSSNRIQSSLYSLDTISLYFHYQHILLWTGIRLE